MKDIQSIRLQYISAAHLHAKTSVNGDYRTANKQFAILKKIYQNIEKGNIDKAILLELLNHYSISVRAWAAAHLLRLRHEVKKAKSVLQEIASIEGETAEDRIISLDAEKTLDVWKEDGSLDF